MRKLISFISASVIMVPLVSFALSAPMCTYKATPSLIPAGVPTQVTLHYTISPGNWWVLWSLYGYAGGGSMAYGTSGDQKVTVSSATNYNLFVIDLATGNAHFCQARISTFSHVQPQ